jgi:hypothetical protein
MLITVFVVYGSKEEEQEKDYIIKIKIPEELEPIKKNIKKLSPKGYIKIKEDIIKDLNARLFHNTLLFHNIKGFCRHLVSHHNTLNIL